MASYNSKEISLMVLKVLPGFICWLQQRDCIVERYSTRNDIAVISAIKIP